VTTHFLEIFQLHLLSDDILRNFQLLRMDVYVPNGECNRIPSDGPCVPDPVL
jgi:hypothetical protein